MADFDLDSKMQKVIDHLGNEYQGIRTGRAHPGLVSDIKADYYGVPTPIKQMATVNVPETKLIVVTPFDKTAVKAIEKAILASSLGITPIVDGDHIRVTMPELTGERRKELSKMVSKIGEESKVAVRNIRRDANDFFKKLESSSEITEDQLKSELDKVQKTTDKFIAKVDELTKEKEKEIMEKI